jgi:hypothetical protein
VAKARGGVGERKKPMLTFLMGMLAGTLGLALVASLLGALLQSQTAGLDGEPVSDAVVLLVERDGLYEAACRLVDEANARHSEAHGEAKRHQVLAGLQDACPERTNRDRALAIEAAVRR